ncbi:hypothetical protein [Methylobacterium oryzisoli]|uniref:hypothetical protein n=1 Tax=Methylobacterium oryzisoli TaxID=3385502 RepID=UPI0038922C79
MSVRAGAPDPAQIEDRESSLVILARLIDDGEAYRLARIHDLARLTAAGQDTARAEQALHELDALLAAMQAHRDQLQATNEMDRPHEVSAP